MCPMVKPSLGPSGSLETRWMRMGLLSRTKQSWLLRGSYKRKGLTMMKPLHRLQELKPSGFFLHMLPIWVSCASRICPIIPPNNLGPNESRVLINETLFRGMIGLLMYLTASRPDIQFSTCLYARYLANPKESHLIAVKRIFRYLKGTPNLGLCYPKGSGFDLKAYSDLDYARCNLDRKNTSKGGQILGEKLVCWSAKRQSSVAMSSVKADYFAAAGCCAQVLWIKSQLAYYDVLYDKVPIFCDNASAIVISNNPIVTPPNGAWTETCVRGHDVIIYITQSTKNDL
ncbi:hypothetical protein Tco_0547709 [Tanacetum coccineum]